MITQLRQIIRNTSYLYKGLLPFWKLFRTGYWTARCYVVPNRPVQYKVSDKVCQFYPHGQILEGVYWGNFEHDELDFFTSYLRPRMCIVDVGANVGLYTILGSILVGPAGKVHAFEPSRDTFVWLERNIQLNGVHNVFLNQMALSDTQATMVLRADPLHPQFDSHRFVEKLDVIDKLVDTDKVVQCTTLDEYLQSNGIGAIDFLKIDVEGAELLVLEGASRVLSNSKDLTLMLECTRNKSYIAKLLFNHGYMFFQWDVTRKTLLPAEFNQVVETGNVIVRREGWSN